MHGHRGTALGKAVVAAHAESLPRVSRCSLCHPDFFAEDIIILSAIWPRYAGSAVQPHKYQKTRHSTFNLGKDKFPNGCFNQVVCTTGFTCICMLRIPIRGRIRVAAHCSLSQPACSCVDRSIYSFFFSTQEMRPRWVDPH